MAIAEYNVDRYELSDRVNLIPGDLLSGLPENEPFDIICSNPPYVSEAEYAELPSEVSKFEPQMALVAGDGGTALIAKLITQSIPRLVSGGQLIIELSPMIADRCVELVKASGGFGEVKLIKDLAGHKRILSAKRSG